MLLENLVNLIDENKMKCAFVIKSLKTGKKFEYNEGVVVPSASLIKIPIMMEILHQVKDGKISLDDRIVVKEDMKVPYSILSLLESGNSYSIKDVLTLMIIQSDNTATNILMDVAGMDNVNKYIKSLGLKNTILQRKMMDIDARKAGRENRTTALDMSNFLELIYKSSEDNDYYGSIMKNILINQLDSSMMRLNIEDNIVIAHKTGELDGISHDAGIVYLENTDYIFCALTWDALSNMFARKTIGKLSKAAYDYFKKEK